MPLNLTENQLRLVKAIVNNYIGETENANNETDTPSGVDRFLFGGIVVECRNLVNQIDVELGVEAPAQQRDFREVEVI